MGACVCFTANDPRNIVYIDKDEIMSKFILSSSAIVKSNEVYWKPPE